MIGISLEKIGEVGKDGLRIELEISWVFDFYLFFFVVSFYIEFLFELDFYVCVETLYNFDFEFEVFMRF